MENGECDERKYVERTELDFDRSDNETIKFWMLGTIKMKRTLKNYPHSDISMFLIGEGNSMWKIFQLRVY